jgi:sensor histidine kinase YesM
MRTAVTKIDLWALASITPIYLLSINAILFGKALFTNGAIFWPALGITMAIGLAGWPPHAWASIYLRRRFAHERQTGQRVFFTLIAFMLATTLGLALVYYTYSRTGWLGYVPNSAHFLQMLLVGIICNFISLGVQEGLFMRSRWRQSEDEREHFKRESLENNLKRLKQQVHPHFLFNSLNSLSSLISDEPERAEKFLDELVKVYRYMLRTNTEPLVPLATELNFIYSYFHLLKTRHGSGVVLKTTITPGAEQLLLPPLTLQLLVENAVKHNNVHKNTPLLIEICTPEDGRLTVSNNLQKKSRKPESSGTGLYNIRQTYDLLTQPDIEIQETQTAFVVTIPLIKMPVATV